MTVRPTTPWENELQELLRRCAMAEALDVSVPEILASLPTQQRRWTVKRNLGG